MKASMKKTYDGLAKWYKSLFEDGKAPFSFELEEIKGLNGAKKSAKTDFSAITKRWESKVAFGESDTGKIVNAVFEDEKSHLRFELTGTLYNDVPALDYVVTVKNTSATECSPVITRFSSLDASYPLASNEGKYTLGNGNGSLAQNADFEAKTYELAGEKLTFSEIYGRSTDGAWPYFDVDGKSSGLLLAIGWSGNWDAEFENKNGEAVGIKIDMHNFNAYLLPGESIRSERIVFVANEGDNEYGHNLFRKMVISHYTPYCRQGKEFKAPIAINFWGGRNTAFISKVVKSYAEAGVNADVVWLDAAWYGKYPFMGEDRSIGWNDTCGGGWHVQKGVWEDNRNLYPNGLKEVGRYIHANTPYKFMVWWMIEDGRNKPYHHTYEVGNGEKKTIDFDIVSNLTFGIDSYYKKVIDENLGRIVLKLSDDKVYTKMLNYYRNRFSNDDIDYMRIDYWSRPEEAWQDNDETESIELAGEKFAGTRKGISENKYICNLYRFFDTMYKEYPDWMLDNCCSGGRRLDIEMTLRGIPLWRTDYNNGAMPDYNEANQVQTQFLNRWIPLTGIGVARPTPDKYYERSFLCAGPCIDGNKHDANYNAKLKEMVDEFVFMRPYYYGEYYQLLPAVNNKTDWQGYEYYREDMGSAVLVAIAREQTTETEKKGKLVKTFKLRGLDKNKEYLVHDRDDVECKKDYVMKGSMLMGRGVRCEIEPKRIKLFVVSENK